MMKIWTRPWVTFSRLRRNYLEFFSLNSVCFIIYSYNSEVETFLKHYNKMLEIFLDILHFVIFYTVKNEISRKVFTFPWFYLYTFIRRIMKGIDKKTQIDF